ncbi:MAG: sulfatase-like hydrolase/transferase [Lentisphaerae bacterium]|jgi:arylsulfatase|nr:sulfatase-like hydrolase/transferase [Lentisphaerota bacterium]MBT4818369.1 sulfatase-like hydrolase/transferase [Lentisphaerota bacterium]MBT5607861.1 sulfatase-like hydrolase/transferase [Lentisphaerota bacterium]MBT7054843.1 sulfatase-like hydrolase/transferase [Lentisphaerota bacterium]MBT7845583.1 sulfatase-like hydrolase/transferase [Lentisphaerota bacterium]
MSRRQPNILFLMTDEQRFDALGAVNPAVHTPNLDALAADGVLFTRAYTPNPSCVPARAAILTGKYPHQCACPTYITHLPTHETTFMSRLQEAGYHTAHIGKLHVGPSEIELGLDYHDVVDSHGPQPQAPEKDSYQRWLYAAGFRQTGELMRWNPALRLSADWLADPKYHVDEYVGDRGREWLATHPPNGQPWFCTISFPGPHMPFDGGKLPEASLYDPADIDMPVTDYGMLAGKPPHNATADGETPSPRSSYSVDEIRALRLGYYANVTQIDRKVGEIVATLTARGEYDHTLIVFTTDHGDYMGEFGLAAKGQHINEVLMRIPFIIKPPVDGVSAKRESALISSVDIAATCLSVAGAPIPVEMASQDLSRYWQSSEDLDDRDTVYMEAGGIRVLRDRQWKYCHYQDRDYGELYDLRKDPWETTNLWDDPGQTQRKADFSRKMVDRLIALSPRSDMRWNVRAPEL